MKLKALFWPIVGLTAVAVSIWLLYHELRGISLDDVWDGVAVAHDQSPTAAMVAGS